MEKFDSIYIMLGFDCNFNCVYCLQGNIQKEVPAPIFSDSFYAFLDNYPYKNTTRLFFWGGEPLLYYSAICKIVERYTGEFSFGVISNGSLLTQDKVDFFNKHKVHFIFSHDAHITKETRKRDLWEEESFRKCFEKLNSRTINVTVTSKSKPFSGIFSYYPEDEDININPIINTLDNEESRKLASFEPEKIKRDISYLVEGFEKGRVSETNNFKKLLTALLRFLETGDKLERCFDCVYGAKTFNIDTQGNVYVCHNSTDRVGTVEDPYEEIAFRIRQIVSKVREGCSDCKLNTVCGGSCYILQGYGREQQCKRLHTLYGVLMDYLDKKGLRSDD